jgi:hypothetical protein
MKIKNELKQIGNPGKTQKKPILIFLYEKVNKNMINELQILKVAPENTSTKQKIIIILTDEWPLTAKKIYNRLQKEFKTNITYQAVHKIIKELTIENIIVKNVNTYKLNIEWIQNSKRLMTELEKKYLENEKIKISENSEFGLIELEYNSMTDLAVSVAKLLFSRQLARNSEDKSFVCIMEYGWWIIKFRFEHLELLGKMALTNYKPIAIIRKKTTFGEWIRKQYIRSGGISPPTGTKFEIEEDIFIQGNYIIEVKFDNETKKFFQNYYLKWKNSEDLFKDFGIKEEPKINAIVRITKNEQMADYFRKKIYEIVKKYQ